MNRKTHQKSLNETVEEAMNKYGFSKPKAKRLMWGIYPR